MSQPDFQCDGTPAHSAAQLLKRERRNGMCRLCLNVGENHGTGLLDSRFLHETAPCGWESPPLGDGVMHLNCDSLCEVLRKDATDVKSGHSLLCGSLLELKGVVIA